MNHIKAYHHAQDAIRSVRDDPDVKRQREVLAVEREGPEFGTMHPVRFPRACTSVRVDI